MAKAGLVLKSAYTYPGPLASSISVPNPFALPHPASAHVATPVVDDYRVVILADSPFAYWRLGESQTIIDAAGAAIDEIGNHHGAYIGAITGEEPGLVTGSDKSVLFSATNQAVNVGTLGTFGGSVYSGITIEAWCDLPERSSDSSWFVGSEVLGGSGLPWNQFPVIGLNYNHSSKLIGFLWLIAVPFAQLIMSVSAPTLDDDTRHYVAVTVNGALETGQIYLDGVALSGMSIVTIGGPVPLSNMISNVWLGNIAGGFSHVRGHVDEVAIYDSVLTAAQILAHYNAGIAAQGTILDGRSAVSLGINGVGAGPASLDGVAAQAVGLDARAAQAQSLDGVAAGAAALDAKGDNL